MDGEPSNIPQSPAWARFGPNPSRQVPRSAGRRDKRRRNAADSCAADQSAGAL